VGRQTGHVRYKHYHVGFRYMYIVLRFLYLTPLDQYQSVLRISVGRYTVYDRHNPQLYPLNPSTVLCELWSHNYPDTIVLALKFALP